MVEKEEESDFRWRMWVAAILTALGALYYLVFLAYFSRGIPIEKIHTVMTDGWSDFTATYVPLVAPVFLGLGLLLWYIHSLGNKKKVVSAPEPEYKFEFNTFDKSQEADQKPEVDYVFKSRNNSNTNIPD